MNSPTEALEAIHASLGSLPSDLASLMSNKPELPDFDFASSAGLPSMADTPFPSVVQQNMGGDSDAFPTLPGFSSAASSMPQSASVDNDALMVGHLEEISRGIQQMAKGGGERSGARRPQGPVQRGGQSVYVADLEADEGFGQASPSIDRSSTAGLRGAGGYGFGSRYAARASSLHGGKGPSRGGQNEYLEHGGHS